MLKLAAGIVVALIIIIIVVLYFLIQAIGLAAVRDLAIIAIVALFAVTVILLLFIAFALAWTVNALRQQVMPTLDSINRTLAAVRGTTIFAGETVISPIIRVSATAAAARGMVQSLMRGIREKGA